MTDAEKLQQELIAQSVGETAGHAHLTRITTNYCPHCKQLADRVKRLEEALIRLRDCDWVNTPLDRMDAVRDIARNVLEG